MMDIQPNISDQTIAPMAMTTYQGNNFGWVSPRSLGVIGGGLTLLIIGAVAMRSTAIVDKPVNVAPMQSNAPNLEAIDKVILEGTKDSLADIRIATDIKITQTIQAMLVERSQEILTEAKRQVADKNSSCFRSQYREACFISKFIPEKEARYKDAVLSRKWESANQSLFDIKAARIALDGAPSVVFTPNITSAAIIKELEIRVNILKQSDNAIAAELTK
jgi:hypothetical protein